MKPETVFLVERPYQDIIDDILIAILGGVANEPLRFDAKTDLYVLNEAARDVRSVTGLSGRVGASGGYRQFVKNVDYVFNVERNAVIWQSGGTWPQDDTLFYVDYLRQQASSPLSDVNVGSVTRTLGEAVGREIATVYQQVNLAYFAAFIDTATGQALELVVSILGLTRRCKDHAVGLVTFFRAPDCPGTVYIPEGVLVNTTSGVQFQTAQARSMPNGQLRIDVPVRAVDAFWGEGGCVGAGEIVRLTQPIAGIEAIKNFENTFLSASDETDNELRQRAKVVLRGLGKGTAAALLHAVLQSYGYPRRLHDPNDTTEPRPDPGNVVMTVDIAPERFHGMRRAVEETRAAGICTTICAPYVIIRPRILAYITRDLTDAEQLAVEDAIIEALQAYVEGLAPGQPADGTAMLAVMRSVKHVKPRSHFVDLRVWRADMGSDERLPGGKRRSARRLLKGKDDEIERGEFQVHSPEGWWIALDMDRGDVLLRE